MWYRANWLDLLHLFLSTFSLIGLSADCEEVDSVLSFSVSLAALGLTWSFCNQGGSNVIMKQQKGLKKMLNNTYYLIEVVYTFFLGGGKPFDDESKSGDLWDGIIFPEWLSPFSVLL